MGGIGLVPEHLPLKVGDVIAGKYHVDGFLGRGGMGAVFAAMHAELKRRVAIKVLAVPAYAHREALARVKTEVQAIAALSSPHVVHINDVGMLDAETPYMVMELLEGESLAARLERGPIDPTFALKILLELCDALAEAHALGIVHRDVKPENVFLARRKSGQVITKILDFGIAKVTNEWSTPANITQGNQLVGTPMFMAPERLLSDGPLTDRVDVWSLGVLAFQMATGRSPFKRGNLIVMARQIVSAPIPSIRSIRPDADDALVAAVERCLVRDPTERCSVAELARILSRAKGSDDALASTDHARPPDGPLPRKGEPLLSEDTRTPHMVGPPLGLLSASQPDSAKGGDAVTARSLRRPAAVAIALVALGVIALVVLTTRGRVTDSGTSALSPTGSGEASASVTAPRETSPPAVAGHSASSPAPASSSLPPPRARALPRSTSGQPPSAPRASAAPASSPTNAARSSSAPADER